MPPHRPHFVVAAALVLLFADAGSATVADRSTAPWGSVLSPPQALKNLQTGWTPEGGGHGAVLQRLRGGGCMDWFSCFGGGQQGQAGGAQNSIDPATGKRKKKIRAGRMEKSTVIAAPISTVYTVITDFEHYPDWCGTGIKRMVVKDKSPGHQEIEYQTGSMGFTFYFKMFWGTSQPNVVSFRNVERQGVINLLRGDYTLTDNGDGTTKVDFLIVADCSGPIPNFIKVAIAKLIVEIALFHMKRYVESPRCTENLAKYNKLPNKFNTMRRLMTNLYTKMPGVGGKQGRFMPPLRWLRQQLVRGASITARFGAAAALLHTIIARKEPEASPAADNSRSRFGKRGAEKR